MARGSLEPLESATGMSWRAADLVLKPGSEERFVVWLAEVSACIGDDPHARLMRPVPALDGRLVVGGWSATQWSPGERRPGDVDALLEVSGAFHRQVAAAAVPCPPFLRGRTDRWATADRVAWGEEAPSRYAPSTVRQLVRDLAPILAEPWTGGPSQLVHGDLAGNVLFGEGSVPGVIDLSPRWRPAAWADAVVVVDAVAWHGTPLAHAEAFVETRPLGSQLLARAIVFRAVSDPDPEEAYAELVRACGSAAAPQLRRS